MSLHIGESSSKCGATPFTLHCHLGRWGELVICKGECTNSGPLQTIATHCNVLQKIEKDWKAAPFNDFHATGLLQTIAKKRETFFMCKNSSLLPSCLRGGRRVCPTHLDCESSLHFVIDQIPLPKIFQPPNCHSQLSCSPQR